MYHCQASYVRDHAPTVITSLLVNIYIIATLYVGSSIYAKPQEDDVIEELADSLRQMQQDAFTIKEESLAQFKSIGQGN